MLYGIVLAVGMILSTTFAQTGGSSYYVSSPNGNDSWSGLLSSPNSSYTDGPFRTLARAQAAMRNSSTLKNAVLRAGTFSVASTWSFYSVDNGESWNAYPGETATLDGGGFGVVNLNTGGVNHVTFQGLTFQNMGPTSLWLGGSDTITLRWNNFYNCNQVCIGGGHVTNSIIDSNTINGQSPGSVAGPGTDGYYAINFWYGSSNNRITHNLIENCQGGGIQIGAGLGDPTISNNIIDRNIFKSVNTNVKDAGAIYMGDMTHSSTGTQITNNIINGNGGVNYSTNWTKAIYFDDGMTNVLVSGNVCNFCGGWAFQIHGGDHITVVNNIFDLSSPGTQLCAYQFPWTADYGMTGNVFERNIIYYSGAPTWIWNVQIHPSDGLPMDSGNLYYSASGADIPNGVGPNGPTVIDAHPVYANPQFTDPSSANYSMPSSSPAYTLIGFQPLPTDQGPLPMASQGGTDGPIANGTYTIRNNSSGLILDDPSSSPPGAQVIQFTQNVPQSANQRWIVTYNSAKQAYTIVNQSSGGYLTDTGILGPGQSLYGLFENSPRGDNTQLWTIYSGSGAYMINNIASGRVLDDPGSNPNSLTKIIVYVPNGGHPNQGWIFQ